MVSEKQKMLAGQMYHASDLELVKERKYAHGVCRAFNSVIDLEESDRNHLLKLFGSSGKGVHIESPFFCDYGYNISLGENVYFNVNVTILDCAPVSLGDCVKLGPGVQIYTAGHSLEPNARAKGDEFALPVVIGRNVWIGGAAIILPGVRIGDDAVIGAGAVVTNNVPAGALAVGNPARVIRELV